VSKKGGEKMIPYFIRILFLLGSAGAGYGLFADKFVGAISFSIVALLVIGLEVGLRRVRLKAIIAGIVGLILGLTAANLMAYPLGFIGFSEPTTVIIRISLNLILGYLGMVVGLKKKDELVLGPLGLVREKAGAKSGARSKILDTSVIIDGRIADLCETGFVEGALIIPRFILKELQDIADSSDSLKRNRGRRGLDILNRIEKQGNIQVKIYEKDFPEVREVDGKLVQLAKLVDGVLVTNDFNLNKVAKLQGVDVLNINELANALKPVVLPGEMMNVRVIKEGKEAGQGVAYLNDGTMVVIDNGRDCLGRTVPVSVTSVLQTTAGRMIFTQLKERKEA